jgi:hypothetical protein
MLMRTPHRWVRRSASSRPASSSPASPSSRMPAGDGWIHELKHDGSRVLAFKDGEKVRCGRAMDGLGLERRGDLNPAPRRIKIGSRAAYDLLGRQSHRRRVLRWFRAGMCPNVLDATVPHAHVGAYPVLRTHGVPFTLEVGSIELGFIIRYRPIRRGPSEADSWPCPL